MSITDFLRKIAVILPDSLYLRIIFFKNHRSFLHLKNPKTINEKIQWLKLNDRTPIHTICADKYLVRDYIKKEIGEEYLIPLLYQTENISDITSKVIPEIPCIIKTNHYSGYVYILRSKNEFDITKFKNVFKGIQNKNFYYVRREWQYKNIKPRFIIEELLLDKNGEIPKDYKFHCINGKIVFIQVDSDRFKNPTRNLYDTNWNLLPYNWSSEKKGIPIYKTGDPDLAPDNLKEMIVIAEKLAAKFKFVRIDLYSNMNKIYFGEITFHMASGFAPFSPRKYDRIIGDKLHL